MFVQRPTTRNIFIGNPAVTVSEGKKQTAFTLGDVAWNVWLEAYLLTGLNDTDPISTFTDQSGNGNSPTAAGAARPTLQTVTFNSNTFQVARFDGTDDTMSKAFTTLAQPNTIFVVATSPRSGDTIADGLTQRNSIFSNSSKYGMFAGVFPFLSTFSVDSSFHLHTCIYNGASSVHRIDGVEVNTGNAGSQGLGGLRLGADTGGAVNFLNGDIAAYFVVNSLLDSTAISNVEGILLPRYIT